MTYWVQGPCPRLPTDGDGSHCQANTDNRCLHAEQVFVDGNPLGWVTSNPKPVSSRSTPPETSC